MFLEMCKTGLHSCSNQSTRKETPGLASQTLYAAMLLWPGCWPAVLNGSCSCIEVVPAVLPHPWKSLQDFILFLKLAAACEATARSGANVPISISMHQVLGLFAIFTASSELSHNRHSYLLCVLLR